jgi:hypothetical protein
MGLMPERGEGRGIVGEEVADNDSHGRIGKGLAGGIIVGVGDFEEIATVNGETAAIGKKNNRN